MGMGIIASVTKPMNFLCVHQVTQKVGSYRNSNDRQRRNTMGNNVFKHMHDLVLVPLKQMEVFAWKELSLSLKRPAENDQHAVYKSCFN